MMSNRRETEAVCIECALGAVIFLFAVLVVASIYTKIHVKTPDAETIPTSGIITTTSIPEGTAPYDGPIVP